MYINSLFIKVACLSSACVGFAAFLGFSFLRNNNALTIGNYHSYIDGEVAADLKKKYDVVFDWFGDDKDVATKFNNKNFDASFVSNATFLDLAQQNLLKPIDWSRLGLKYGSNETCLVNTPETAKHIFSKNVNIFIDSDPQFLKYGIPYFMSYFSFAYRGEKIQDLEGEKTWSEILKTVSEQERFKKDGTPKLSFIDDSRGLFALSEMMNNEPKAIVQASTGPKTQPQKPKDSITRNYFDEAFKKYRSLGINKETLGTNPVLFESDSVAITNKLVKKEINGALFYSGDSAYAIQGGQEAIEIPENDLHIVTPSKNVYVLDMLAISKHIPKEKEDKLYKLIGDLFFDGYAKKNMFVSEGEEAGADDFDVNNLTCPTTEVVQKGTRAIDTSAENSNSVSSTEEESKEEDKPYKYMPVRNFDFTYYTPVLRRMIENMKCDETTYIDDNSTYKDMMKKLLLVDDDLKKEQVFYEDYLDETSSSRLSLSYSAFTSTL